MEMKQKKLSKGEEKLRGTAARLEFREEFYPIEEGIYFICLKRLRKSGVVSRLAINVWENLAGYSNIGSEGAFPSKKTIADNLRTSKGYVRKCMLELQRKLLIEIQPDKKHGRGHKDFYSLLWHRVFLGEEESCIPREPTLVGNCKEDKGYDGNTPLGDGSKNKGVTNLPERGKSFSQKGKSFLPEEAKSGPNPLKKTDEFQSENPRECIRESILKSSSETAKESVSSPVEKSSFSNSKSANYTPKGKTQSIAKEEEEKQDLPGGEEGDSYTPKHDTVTDVFNSECAPVYPPNSAAKEISAWFEKRASELIKALEVLSVTVDGEPIPLDVCVMLLVDVFNNFNKPFFNSARYSYLFDKARNPKGPILNELLETFRNRYRKGEVRSMPSGNHKIA